MSRSGTLRCVIVTLAAALLVSPGLQGTWQEPDLVGTYRARSTNWGGITVQRWIMLHENGEATVQVDRTWTLAGAGSPTGRPQEMRLDEQPEWRGRWDPHGRGAVVVRVRTRDRPNPWAFKLWWSPRQGQLHGLRRALANPWWTPQGWLEPARPAADHEHVWLEQVAAGRPADADMDAPSRETRVTLPPRFGGAPVAAR